MTYAIHYIYKPMYPYTIIEMLILFNNCKKTYNYIVTIYNLIRKKQANYKFSQITEQEEIKRNIYTFT